MTDIIVFQPPDSKKVTLNKTDKELMYDKFEKTASIDEHHYKTLLEIDNYEDTKKTLNTNIPSILLKPLLKYCTPIIREVPEYSFIKKKIDLFNKNVKKKTEEKYYYITMQLDTPINCIIRDKVENIISVPSDITFKVVGIKIPNYFKKILDKCEPNFIFSTDHKELMASGSYGILDF